MNPLPVDEAFTREDRRRFTWDDAYSQFRELSDEARLLIEQRRRKPKPQRH